MTRTITNKVYVVTKFRRTVNTISPTNFINTQFNTLLSWQVLYIVFTCTIDMKAIRVYFLTNVLYSSNNN